MSNRPEGHETYNQGGIPQAPGTFEGQPAAPPAGGTAYSGQAGAPAQAPSGYPASSGHSSGQWAGDQSGHHGPLGGRGRMSLKDSLKSTEFWVFVVVSLALLIAAAVSDADDGGGFGPESAWRFVTALAAAYILSRGLAKLGNRDDDRHHH